MLHRRFDVDSPRRPRRRGRVGVALLVLVAGAAVPSACSTDKGPTACGPISREALDPNFLIHVLAGAKSVRYRTDPPTSGPHQPAPRLARVQTRPLPRPVQVGLLEGGNVLIQYRNLSSTDVTRLTELAGDHVLVAPNPSLQGATRVVATGWIHKRSCTAVDTGALGEFIHQRAGKGPGTP